MRFLTLLAPTLTIGFVTAGPVRRSDQCSFHAIVTQTCTSGHQLISLALDKGITGSAGSPLKVENLQNAAVVWDSNRPPGQHLSWSLPSGKSLLVAWDNFTLDATDGDEKEYYTFEDIKQITAEAGEEGSLAFDFGNGACGWSEPLTKADGVKECGGKV